MDGGWQRDSGGAGGSGRRPGDSPWDALKSFGEM